MGHEFEDIEIKRNAPEILKEQLKKRRKKAMISTGAMSDPYVNLENQIGYTRQCLEIIEEYGFGVTILTKSERILRDLNILKRIHAKTKCVVQMTLTTCDEHLVRVLEPNVSTTLERFQALEIFRDNEIPAVVWFAPFLPFINDSEENLRGLLDYCIQAKVKGIVCFGFGMTLREGNREYFYQKLDKHFPELKERYIKQYGNDYEIPVPGSQNLYNVFKSICLEHGILYKKDEVFEYLQTFESKTGQLSLF
jgi:DNA repair photolyase